MSDPFIGEIQLLAFNFAPRGSAFAAGQLLPINQNTALYSLIGTTYGGDDRTTFALPNLASRQACNMGTGTGTTRRDLGQAFGSFAVALDQTKIPSHQHSLTVGGYRPDATALAAVPTASSGVGYSGSGTFHAFAPVAGLAALNAAAITTEGAGEPHPNTQPYLGLTYTIVLEGIFPPRP